MINVMEVENEIAEVAVREILSRGQTIAVNNGDKTANVNRVRMAMGRGPVDTLHVYDANVYLGAVRFRYGYGSDVMTMDDSLCNDLAVACQYATAERNSSMEAF